MYAYVEEPRRFRRPLQRGRLDDDYDPQVDHEFGGAGCRTGWVLGQFCGYVSLFETAPHGDMREDPLSLLKSARRKRRYVPSIENKRPVVRRWK